MRGQRGFFDVDDRLKRLSDMGDQLEAFGFAVDFEAFRPELVAALSYSNGSQGGRPPFDPVMMFKILVIQAANNLSDERAEFLINDRLSFMRFLGLSLSDRVPDARTIWLFRERLTKAGAINALERVTRQRLCPVGCHVGGSGHFLLPATADEIQFALDGAARAVEPVRDLVVGIAFHFQQGNGTEVLVLE